MTFDRQNVFVTANNTLYPLKCYKIRLISQISVLSYSNFQHPFCPLFRFWFAIGEIIDRLVIKLNEIMNSKLSWQPHVQDKANADSKPI